MEPRLPSPHLSPEAGAHNLEMSQKYERGSQAGKAEMLDGVEKKISSEARESDPSQAMSAATPAAQVMQPAQSALTVKQQGPAVNQVGVPASASDDDIIEKEWVSKAKQIIKSTKNDPYMQELEVSKLQADYLKKRYGKDVKVPGS